jgi:uncharacterized protein YjiK
VRREAMMLEPTLPYDLENPELYELDDELLEISGITAVSDGSALMAINDEAGKLYKLDLRGKITGTKSFGKGGDYEDVAVYDSAVFVMKSNGDLYHIEDPTADCLIADLYIANLGNDVEFESLAADPGRGHLLLLVKDGEGSKDKAPVYGFDPSKGEFTRDHVFLVDPTEVAGKAIKGRKLRASAMAIHPVTGEIYVISSINRMLLVCDAEGKAVGFWKLAKKKFPQPEGICFLPNGDMFISSEGRSRPARLFHFAYKGSAEF